MELLDKGKHCEEEYCHQLDFLPMKCKACSKLFCSSHIKYDDHSCKEAYKFDYKIPTCLLCNQVIEFQRGKDLDLCLAEHMQKCEEESKRSKKQINNKCAILHCKSKEIIPFECNNCNKKFCIKHRMQEDHECKSRIQFYANSIFKTCGQQHISISKNKGNNLFTASKY